MNQPTKNDSNIFVTLFARIWAFWGLFSFATTFLIMFIPTMIPYLIPGVRGQYIFIQISRFWMWTWLHMIGCPIKIKGKEHFEKGKTYVICYNHNALLDVPLSAPFVPGANKTIAKASFAKVPLFGWFYRKGSVLVDRDDDVSKRKSYEEMKRTLLKGMHMCIYPEGTRNRSGEPLKKFQGGAFKLAIDTKKDIIPTLIFGTTKAMPIHKPFYLLPTKLEMHFLPPVSSEGMGLRELMNKTHDIMTTYYVAHQ